VTSRLLLFMLVGLSSRLGVEFPLVLSICFSRTGRSVLTKRGANGSYCTIGVDIVVGYNVIGLSCRSLSIWVGTWEND